MEKGEMRFHIRWTHAPQERLEPEGSGQQAATCSSESESHCEKMSETLDLKVDK